MHRPVIKIKTRVIENPTTSELRQCQQFADQNWGKHQEPEKELKDNFFAKPNITILAYFQNRLVGLLNLYLRKINVGDKSVTVGGIGGVVTHIKFRRKGVATTLLNKAKRILKSKMVDVALLSTNIQSLGSLYCKIGFVPLGKPYYFTSKIGVEKRDGSGMIAPIKSKKVFNHILLTDKKISIGSSNF